MRASNRERILTLLRTRGPMSQADLAPARGRALALSRSAGFAVGIDFGHSHVRVAVADLAHIVLAEAEEPLDVDHEAHEGVALAGRLVRTLLGEVGVAPDRVTGVGMG